jgi:hypothetical protein
MNIHDDLKRNKRKISELRLELEEFYRGLNQGLVHDHVHDALNDLKKAEKSLSEAFRAIN